MKILHLLYSGSTGGIEKLCLDIGKLNPSKHIFCFSCNAGSVYEEMTGSNLDAFCFHLGKANIVSLYTLLQSYCKKELVQTIIIHHDAPMLWLTGCILKVRNRNMKVFVYAHCNYRDFIDSRIKRSIFKLVTNKCDGIIAISNSVKESLIKLGGIKDCKVKVIYNGIDFSKFNKARKIAFEKPMKIIYVGRLIKEKGVHLLIEAISIIKDIIPIKCVIVGDGIELSNLICLCDNLRLNEHITFVGDQKNVAKWLLDADVFVHPATWEEGFGITIIEAMSAGLVCIAFSKGAIPEIINDRIDGILVSETNAKSLSLSMQTVYDQLVVDNCTTMRENAKLRAMDFSIVEMVELLEKHVLN